MAEGHYIYRSTEEERLYESDHLDVEETHRRAKNSLAEYEIKLEKFVNYDPHILERDAAKVARLEKSFDRSPSKIYADILEAIVLEHGEKSEWFGQKTDVIKTSRFDDYVNKIDMIVETETDDKRFSHLALGVDVTFGSRDLHEKFIGEKGIKANIVSGKLAEIKYFHSDRQHFTGEKRRIPQIVIGVEIEKVKELGLLWMNRRNKELDVHPVQITILEEVALQLETFAGFAKNIGKIGLVPILELELQKIKELLAQKKAAGIKGLKDDKVFEEIKRNLLHFIGHDTKM